MTHLRRYIESGRVRPRVKRAGETPACLPAGGRYENQDPGVPAASGRRVDFLEREKVALSGSNSEASSGRWRGRGVSSV